jgi:hypothetical protein
MNAFSSLIKSDCGDPPRFFLQKLDSDGFVWPCINTNASLYEHFHINSG